MSTKVDMPYGKRYKTSIGIKMVQFHDEANPLYSKPIIPKKDLRPKQETLVRMYCTGETMASMKRATGFSKTEVESTLRTIIPEILNKIITCDKDLYDTVVAHENKKSAGSEKT